MEARPPHDPNEQMNLSPAEAHETQEISDQLHARNFLVSFPLSQGRAIETQPILFEYLRRQYTPEQLSNLDAIDENVRTRFLPKFRIPTAEHTTDFLADGIEPTGEEANAFIAGEFETGWSDYIRVMRQEYSPEDIEGEYPDIGPGSLHEVSDARLVAKIAEDLMRSDRNYILYGRPNRRPESDAFESLFREHILNERPMQTEQFQQMGRDVLGLLRELGLDQPDSSHVLPDDETLARLGLGIETVLELRLLRRVLQQEWEEKHPGQQFNEVAAFEHPSSQITTWGNANYEHGLITSLNQEQDQDPPQPPVQQQPQQQQQGKIRAPGGEHQETAAEEAQLPDSIELASKNKPRDSRTLFIEAAQNDPERLDILMYRLLENPRDERILRDRFFHDKSLNELAADHEISPQAVGQIIRKSLQKLQASGELEGTEPEPAEAEVEEVAEVETKHAKRLRQNREQYQKRKVEKILAQEALKAATSTDDVPEHPDEKKQQTRSQEPQAKMRAIGKTALPFDLSEDMLPDTFSDIQAMKKANPGPKPTDGSKKSKGKTK